VRASGAVYDVLRDYELASAGPATGSGRVDRSPTSDGRRRFGAVTLTDAVGTPRGAFAFGDMLTLHVEMGGRCGHRTHFVEWFLNDAEQGNRVSWGATHACADAEVGCDVMTMSFTIGPLPLAEGRYSFSLVMGVPGVEDLDFWHDAITFEMTNADPIAGGFHYSTRYAPTVIPYRVNMAAMREKAGQPA
jgi:hypothetical protein